MNFTDEPTCIDGATGPAVNSCSTGTGDCDITSVNLINITSCNDNGTSDPGDDFFTADVQVNFINPPGSGNLQIEPGGDAIGTYSVPVVNLMGGSHTFIGVQFKADGTVTVVEVEFTIPANVCTQTIAGPTVAPCSAVCDITGVSLINILSCNDNGTSDPTDDYYSADVVVNFVNPPATGNLQIEPGGDAIGTYSIPVANLMGNTHTFIGVQFRADGMLTVIEVEFTIPANVCVQTIAGPTIDPCSYSPPVLNCPANVTVSCAGFVPPPNPASVSETHDCPGNVTITHVSDVISGQTCPNKYTITRTYQAIDECDNTAICVQTITVNDQTPPVLGCFANVTVSCLNNVPPANPAAISFSDNCGSGTGVILSQELITGQSCPNRLTITRIYIGTDLCGNTASCVHVITVNDQTPPVLTCPAPVTVQCASQVPPVNSAGIPTSDNCGGAATVTHVGDAIINQTCANRFTIQRTYRSTDQCGNSATCVQVITVFDNTPPTLTCPAPVTVQCASQVPPVNTSGITAADNCGTVTVTHVSDVITNQTCPNRFTLNRIYRATDACGNSATCLQVITVFDNTPPVITFSDPLIEGLLNGGTFDVQCFAQDPAWEIPRG
jgi:hypothetical protein